jgi:hypothetical protein
MIESVEYVSDTPPPWAEALFDALKICTPNQADTRRAMLPYLVQTMSELPERAVLAQSLVQAARHNAAPHSHGVALAAPRSCSG